MNDNHEIAMVAAGCFWGVQYYYDQAEGVQETEVGYTGGHIDHPTYEQVCSHTTGHAEALKITYDPDTISFEGLLVQFFYMHDPTQLNRQGPDVGDSYRSAIFYADDEQLSTAKQLIERLNKEEYNGKIVTTLEPAGAWWPAEDYHQKYALKTGQGMCHVPYKPLEEL